jgi:hypothetical protein
MIQIALLVIVYIEISGQHGTTFTFTFTLARLPPPGSVAGRIHLGIMIQ